MRGGQILSYCYLKKNDVNKRRKVNTWIKNQKRNISMWSYRNNVFNNYSDAVISVEISAFVLCCHNFDYTSLVWQVDTKQIKQ